MVAAASLTVRHNVANVVLEDEFGNQIEKRRMEADAVRLDVNPDGEPVETVVSLPIGNACVPRLGVERCVLDHVARRSDV